MAKYLITFKNGETFTTNLEKDELLKRMNRLDWLRVATECFEEDSVYYNICKKATNSYNKHKNFTGIIRLTKQEKESLAYLHKEYMSEEEVKAIEFYKGDNDWVD